MTAWLAPRPELAAGWERLQAAVDAGPLAPELLESCRQLVRRRIRFESGGDAPASALEAACVELAEQFAIDVHGVQDAHVAAVREHVGDAGVVQLVVALGLAEGEARAEALVDAGGG